MKPQVEKDGTGRRRFLIQMGVLTGAAMLPSCATNTVKAKEGCIKVKVVFAYHLDDVQAVPDWPNVGYDFRPHMENIVNAMNARVKDVQFIAAKSKDEVDAAAMAAEDGDDIAGYVVVQMNCWNGTIFGLTPTKKPILYVPHPYAGDGGWLTYVTRLLDEGQPYFAYAASIELKDIITMSTAFSKLNGGSAEDFFAEAEKLKHRMVPAECRAKANEGPLKCLSAEETLEKIKGKKILSISNDDPALFKEIEQTLGIKTQVVTFDEFNEVYAGISDNDARKVADGWKKKALDVYDAKDEDIFMAAKSYLTQKALIAKHNAYAVTINCLGGCYQGRIKGYPCLGFMQLQDEGLMGVCENDMSAVTSMIVFQAMTGRTGYISDPVLDFPNRSIIYAHCVSTTKFLGPDGPSSPFSILTHSEDRKGASVRTIAPIGYPVTTVFLNVHRKELTIHTGVVTGNSGDDRACRTKIIAEVTGDYDKMHRSWYAWHRATFLGDFAKDAAAFGEKIGYKVIFES